MKKLVIGIGGASGVHLGVKLIACILLCEFRCVYAIAYYAIDSYPRARI